MRNACTKTRYRPHMPKLLQIRNLPDSTHDELRRRAKLAGMTLSAFAGEILNEAMSRRDMKEIFEEVQGSGVAIDVDDVIANIRAVRDASG
jgi:plasmid stability protein